MTTPIERWLLDTNVWIFGLRRDDNFTDSARLLDRIGSFLALVPLQVIKELQLNLTESEMADFYRLLNHFPEHTEMNWEPVPAERTAFCQQFGCRKGDAVIAAHAEALSATLIISNNRQFLQTVSSLPAEILTPAQALSRLPEVDVE